MPTVGSSRIIKHELFNKVSANDTLLCSPPDNSHTSRLPLGISNNSCDCFFLTIQMYSN